MTRETKKPNTPEQDQQVQVDPLRVIGQKEIEKIYFQTVAQQLAEENTRLREQIEKLKKG